MRSGPARRLEAFHLSAAGRGVRSSSAGADSTTIDCELTTWPEFQAFEARSDVESDLALHAERPERDRIVGAADQHVAPQADTDRRAALRAGIVAREVAGPEAVDRREHAPRQRSLLGDAEVEADFADSRDV